MAERDDTKLLGLRGLYIEAQRRKDTVAARAYAEEAAQRRARARLGRAGGAGIPLRRRRLGGGARGARPQQPLRPDRQDRIQAPARGAADRARARRRRRRARPRPLAGARCREARADARSGRRTRRAAARRSRRTAPRQPHHREGLGRPIRIPISPRPTRIFARAIPRASGWRACRRWR